jgi:hypothetical protein
MNLTTDLPKILQRGERCLEVCGNILYMCLTIQEVVSRGTYVSMLEDKKVSRKEIQSLSLRKTCVKCLRDLIELVLLKLDPSKNPPEGYITEYTILKPFFSEEFKTFIHIVRSESLDFEKTRYEALCICCNGSVV